uniref:Uncharacterized protein n=2 Tax=Oryza TaxID=4527 RepID=A0A0E0I4P7_ORYNI
MPVMIGFSPSFLKAPLQFEAGRAQANFAVHRQLFVATARSSVGGIDDGMHGQMSCAAHMTGCRRPVHRSARRDGCSAGQAILLFVLFTTSFTFRLQSRSSNLAC